MYNNNRDYDSDVNYDPRSQVRMQWHEVDVFVPNGSETLTECIQNPNCDCVDPLPGTHIEYTDECGFAWVFVVDPVQPDGCDTFDPANPPDWYLQYIVDHFTPVCGATPVLGPGPVILLNCNIAATAYFVLMGGDPTNPLYAGYWAIILGWWATNGQQLMFEYCGGDVTTPPNPNGSLKIMRTKSVRFPSGAYVVAERCREVLQDVECDGCDFA